MSDKNRPHPVIRRIPASKLPSQVREQLREVQNRSGQLVTPSGLPAAPQPQKMPKMCARVYEVLLGRIVVDGPSLSIPVNVGDSLVNIIPSTHFLKLVMLGHYEKKGGQNCVNLLFVSEGKPVEGKFCGCFEHEGKVVSMFSVLTGE